MPFCRTSFIATWIAQSTGWQRRSASASITVMAIRSAARSCTWANAWIMVSGPRGNRASPVQTGHGSQSLTVFVDDVDAHFAKVKGMGAKIVEELQETIYGERQYGVEDLEGHHWLFSMHVRDVDPGEWGAVVASAR